MNAKGRILAVDYGEKNIGLAYCDALGLTVQPMTSMPNCGTANLLKKLRALIRTLDIQEIVLGIPFKMDGTRGDAALRMEQLMEELKAALKIPISGVDELLSTVEATEFWRSMNKRRQKKYQTVDSLAAALILERFLKEN
jgi:putative holliday junction resolvase